MIRQIKAAVEVYEHLPRYGEILRVFFKYGFADLLKLAHLGRLLEIKATPPSEPGTSLHQKPLAARFRLALEELGPTFVKFGQILSSRRDLINEPFFEELRKLQDRVPPFPAEQAKRILEEDLKRPLDEIFHEFDETPVAGASIAQVHRARLCDGKEVAVKVRRPDIEKVIAVDVAILEDAARFLERHVEELAALNPVGVVREFARTLSAELDFMREAGNLERFAKQFRGNRWVRVPRVYRDLSGERILTMEFLAGLRVDRPEDLRAHGIHPSTLSERMSRLIFQQMFEFGFFHGDPHPGNFTILSGGVTCLYDYGMMGTLTPAFREDIAAMILGLTEKDRRMVTRALLGMSEQGYAENLRKLESDVEAFGEQYLNRPLKELRLGFIFNRLLDLLMTHQLRMKAEFYLGVKALTQVEAIAVLLHPDLNFVEFGAPYAMRALERKYETRKLLKDFLKSFGETLEWLRDLPTDARDFYERAKSGRYRIPLEHRLDPKGFEPLRDTLDYVANLLAESLLASAALVCSSILILAGVPPLWKGIPLPGLVGLAISALMFLRIARSIWRHGGL
ncbi:MAG: AarF/ABC1/UbiB kinase family protein [Verrucomicrobiae bacterium]|nr:AarF/ABC1/UbiB kinase family protein [Verrucomicrobiae bacterium]